MSQEITKVGDQDLGWLIEESAADESLQQLAEHRVLPRVKIIQALTRPELRDRFSEGSAVLMPGEVEVCAKKGKFLFVPVFFYNEFGILSDRKDQEAPMFLGKSLDEKSDIAVRARDRENRVESYGDGYEKRYVEIFNFPGFLYGDHDLAGTAMSLSFMKGEFMTGKTWASSICLRKVGGQSVPLWAQVWEFTSTYHDKGPDKKWWGATPSNPSGEDPLYIRGDERDLFQGAHLEFKKLYQEQRLETDHEAGDHGESSSGEEAAATSEI